MRSDGTGGNYARVRAAFECSWNAHHWHGYLDDPVRLTDYEAAYKAASQTLTEKRRRTPLCRTRRRRLPAVCLLQDDKTYLYSGSMGRASSLRSPTTSCGCSAAAPTALCPRRAAPPRTKATNGTTSSATGCTCIAAGTAVQPTILYTPRLTAFDAPLAAAQREANGCIWTQRAMK